MAFKNRKRMNTHHQSIHSDVFGNLPQFKPLSEPQFHAYNSYKEGKNLAISGFAGTGKTYLAMSLALEALANDEVWQVRIIRSAVQARDLGHLPGTLEEKLHVYEIPFESLTNQILHRGDAYCILKQKGVLTFESTSFQRGHTYDNTLIIMDESQNCSFSELYGIVSRLGTDSRIILLGDHSSNFQCDLRKGEKSGFSEILSVIENLPQWFDIYELGTDDIVRSGFVKDFIIECDRIKFTRG